MTIAIFWILFSVAVGLYAGSRGRGSGNWFVLSLLISPLIGFIFVLASNDLAKEAAAPGEHNHVRCPHCSEWVLPLANTCKHCGKAITPDPGFAARIEKDAKSARLQSTLMTGVAVLLFLGVIFAWSLRG